VNIKLPGVPFFKSESAGYLLGVLDVLKRTHSTRFKPLKKILKNFGLLWQALKKFNNDNGFFLSSGITFNILIWYIVHLAGYSIFYGSFSTLVIFILWVYYSSTILVVGGEFAYFLEEDQQRSKA